LDKTRLAACANSAGITTLPIWDPSGVGELTTIAPSLPFPIVIKPRSHVGRFRNNKGIVAYTAEELVEGYKQFVAAERRARGSDVALPTNDLPILQQFVDLKSDGVLSVSGFIDRTGEHFVCRQACKVFQRSWPLGVGVCFEARASDPRLSEAVRQLCRRLGYFGVFEVEFLRFNGAWALIDFNPRIYNQIGMDIWRGMPLPLLATLDAAGQAESLKAEIKKASVDDIDCKAVFQDRFTLLSILTALAVTGRMTLGEGKYWWQWLRQNAPQSTDAAIARTDPIPGFVHALSEMYLGLKASPRFLQAFPKIFAHPR